MIGSCELHGPPRTRALSYQLPRERRSPLDRPRRPPAEHARKVLRGEAISRADRSHVLLREDLARRHVAHDEERPPENPARALALARAVAYDPEPLLDGSYCFDHGLELIRLERERAVRARQGA